MASSKISTEEVAEMDILCAGVFSKISTIRSFTTNEGLWPKAANDMFRAGYAEVKKQKRPYFLWLEPDCCPMVSGWLDILEYEYRKADKPLMGCIHDKPFRHMNGVGIWSVDLVRFNPYVLGANQLPFDCVRPELSLKQCRNTDLIWRKLADPDKNLALTFPTVESLDVIPKEAVLTHCCKDQTLIDRLKERRDMSWIKKSIQALKSGTKGVLKREGPLKVALLYICVHTPSEPETPRNFKESHERFVSTYLQFKPSIPHKVIIVNYGGERTEETDRLFAPLNPDHSYSTGKIFDIGTYQAVGKTLDYDFVMFCGSNIHFHRKGWLERMVEAFRKHGDGIYGPMGSYERSPHLRTCCIGMAPSLIRKYPHLIDSRAATYRAESGDWNLTKWVMAQGKPALMVMWDGELEQEDWRKPDNIFRKGDQTNCLVWDRHTKVYFECTPEYRKELERSVRGIHGIHSCDIVCGQKPSKSITIVALTSLAPKSHAIAIKRTAECIPFQCKKLLISPVRLPDFDGQQELLPSPWARNGKWSLEDMADFTLTGLHKYITTDVAIIVHWDGYAINPGRWTNQFLDWDYIGAPWPEHMRFLTRLPSGRVGPTGRVGNGGFSLRSRRWLQVASRLPKLPRGKSEDVYTSISQLNHFTKHGCKIAPIPVAMRWSFEHKIEEFPDWELSDSFGFHGLIDKDPMRVHLKLDNNS